MDIANLSSEQLNSKQRRNALLRRIAMLFTDIMAVCGATALAILARFDFSFKMVEKVFISTAMHFLPFSIIITIVIFELLKLGRLLWQYAGAKEFVTLAEGCMLSAFVQYLCIRVVLKWRYPRSCYIFFCLFLLLITGIVRFSFRMISTYNNMFKTKGHNVKNVMVIGAGKAGDSIIREMKTSSYINKKVCCIIDDDPGKYGRYIHGVRIVGDRNTILSNVAKYNIDEIIIAIPSATKAHISELVGICKETKCELRIIPGIYQLVNGDVDVSKLRKVDITDLLGREQVKVNLNKIMGYVKDKVVLVTGGGGSIGSELCRQLAAHSPRQLIIFDIYENNAYDIQQELIKKYPELNLEVLIGSVRNTDRINSLFELYKPDIVYHAAAHKHVPLMEKSPYEAIKNNVLGTWKVADAAARNNVKRFVMISTDKAVNPTNIMGASKRICEMIVQTYNNRSETEFVAVRFGNVLGSNGSVIPLFKKQIENGGPVTVTHKDIIRYFMTIPEAVSLVLEAGAYAKGGEIFVLDMGEPVRIYDLAVNLIKLSGYTPNEDIKIEITGLRPGEKLYEEMLMKEEGLQETENAMIHIGKPIDFDESALLDMLEEMNRKSRKEMPAEEVRAWVKQLVPTYVCNNYEEH